MNNTPEKDETHASGHESNNHVKIRSRGEIAHKMNEITSGDQFLWVGRSRMQMYGVLFILLLEALTIFTFAPDFVIRIGGLAVVLLASITVLLVYMILIRSKSGDNENWRNMDYHKALRDISAGLRSGVTPEQLQNSLEKMKNIYYENPSPQLGTRIDAMEWVLSPEEGESEPGELPEIVDDDFQTRTVEEITEKIEEIKIKDYGKPRRLELRAGSGGGLSCLIAVAIFGGFTAMHMVFDPVPYYFYMVAPLLFIPLVYLNPRKEHVSKLEMRKFVIEHLEMARRNIEEGKKGNYFILKLDRLISIRNTTSNPSYRQKLDEAIASIKWVIKSE